MDEVAIAVVGGGPAGTSAAEAAASAGAEVRLYEKGVPRADRPEPGADSTDAAGLLDYWFDVMGISYAEFPDHLISAECTGAAFYGPTVETTITDTGLADGEAPFGITFDRSGFDDWLRQRAEAAGADVRVGTGVSSVSSTPSGGWTHTLELADGTTVEADRVILADGPSRSVTLDALSQFADRDRVEEAIGPDHANHIGYQEYRRLPEDAIDDDQFHFWWGAIPGHTAYPWVFPDGEDRYRIGLTMPSALDLATVDDPANYTLIDADDERMPPGAIVVERLLDRVLGVDPDDAPRLDDRGKSNGTEAYPISSTRPIESPVGADLAVAGGAMGTTSAFHEGGDHVAVRTGSIAGRLAAADRLDEYNAAWQDAIGSEIRRNVAVADMVRGYGPDDWDRRLQTGQRVLDSDRSGIWRLFSTGIDGARVVAEYTYRRWQLRDGGYVGLPESAYDIA
ncbi:NAD(P)/FAD-dependent oxidoreductase [Halococcoides cellulosivorans]|uniref:NAD(P)/FAD-dependent oxidoreductase n=1 Tax=Halococcoides cellulosivorans TaxID=1679096 RepID=A0A2R4X0E1_9EURY|nr:NAD(P)/FAD-dependent oxidoreductase [Halococcoides cellulosivorans]AWB27247.1 NAD(P)/FAD-dependent oxidoreductase [Halococcoides cellulosivorans]